MEGNSDVRVAVNGKRWIMNPRCMAPAPSQTPTEDNSGQLSHDLSYCKLGRGGGGGVGVGGGCKCQDRVNEEE